VKRVKREGFRGWVMKWPKLSPNSASEIWAGTEPASGGVDTGGVQGGPKAGVPVLK